MGDEGTKGEEAGDSASTEGPLVFISHDSRDAVVAEAFSNLLSNVSTGMLKTFRSSDKKGSQGFEYGAEWYPELMRRLDAACDVVCLLTRRSLHRPWILYEAGVAKGKLDIPVHGLAIGVPLARAVTGPFAQFQNCDDDVDALSRLVVQLVKRLRHADPNPDLVRQQVEGFLTTIKPHIDSGDGNEEDAGDGDASAKLFEEVKLMFQDLPMRLERAVGDSSRPRARRRLHPGLLHEAAMMSSRGRANPGIAALMGASYVRDEMPWLYEMAAAIYDASLSGNRAVERRAIANFVETLEISMHGPLSRELRSKDAMFMLEELPMLMHHFADMTEGDNDSATPGVSGPQRDQ